MLSSQWLNYLFTLAGLAVGTICQDLESVDINLEKRYGGNEVRFSTSEAEALSSTNSISTFLSTTGEDFRNVVVDQSENKRSARGVSSASTAQRPLGNASLLSRLLPSRNHETDRGHDMDLNKDDPRSKGERDKPFHHQLRPILSTEDLTAGLRKENPKSKGKRDKPLDNYSTLWSKRYNGVSAPIAPYLPSSIRWKINSALVGVFTNRVKYIWEYLDLFSLEEKEGFGNELVDALLNITSDPTFTKNIDWVTVDKVLNNNGQDESRDKRDLTRFGYDCDIGSVTESNDIKHCITTDCKSNPYAMTIYTNLMEKGVMIDYYSIIKHKVAQKYVLFDNKFFLINCKKVAVYEVRTTNCFSDGMIPVTNQREELYLARNGFLVRSAIRERCKGTDEIEAVRETSRWQLHLYSALARLSQVLIFHYDSAQLIHEIFNKEAIESLITLEQETLSGHDKASLYCVIMILFRRYGPLALMVYSSLNLGVSVVLFILSIYKRLNFLSSISILLSVCKKCKDFLKYTEENDIKMRTQLSDGARTMLGREKKSLGSISTHHFRVLYHSATNSARRLDRLEEDLRQRRRAEFGSDFDPDEIDSVATFSSIDLALKDTKN